MATIKQRGQEFTLLGDKPVVNDPTQYGYEPSQYSLLDPGKEERMKKIADRKRIAKQLEASKADDTMEKVSPQGEKPKSKTETVLQGAQAITAATGDSSAKTSDDTPPGSGMDKAMNNALQAGAATGGDPFAMAGAAAIGIIQAEQEREAYKIKKLEEAKLAEAESKQSESKIYQTLAQSMRGMLR